MKTSKMSLANIQGKLSRAEMKNIMAGSGGDGVACTDNSQCTPYGNCICFTGFHKCGCIH